MVHRVIRPCGRGPQPEVVVQARRRRAIGGPAEAGPQRVRVTVGDSGSGIAEAELPRLFDRGYQARDSVAPATGEGGKGLGLAIVKRIAELHGGTVAVLSTLGRGTEVRLVLPCR